MSEVIVITSGKGGVGKTTTTANVGTGLAKLNQKVVMIDTDIGLRNEISQFALLTAFSHWLIPAHGAVGAAQAYMATYIVYFALCSGVFLLWRKRA